ncbi:glycosyltransferase [Actinomyces ruminis]|uniref:Multidrug transporter n=1 Tax=Actinomyces ruminis TaxID=1937003 RepID=A0ABX4MDP6_9ACTO|nr:glycosyltransferase [Actinomyces ruminis]PHP52194.1 multidrug transporter [Actinomyces ruminis]
MSLDQFRQASASDGLAAALDTVGFWAAVVMVAVALTYMLVLACGAYTLAGRRKRAGQRDRLSRPLQHPVGKPLQIVVLMPCLNEAAVIGPSVARLLEDPNPALHVLVVDDGSDDATSDIVGAIADPRVALLRRDPPNARQGKGEALNHAIEIIRARYRDIDPEYVVVGVVDADGHLDPTAWDVARGALRDQTVGAVQLGVRISNRHASLLARMQDIEFVTFTSVFQQGRRRMRSVGMGGNAQFVRLAALNALGRRPWTRSLTEDFDLGIRLNGTGWINEFRGDAAVHQEGVTSLRRLIRQRTRWFQGNLQARNLMGFIARHLRGRARADTLWQVLSPYLLLAGSLLVISFLLMLGLCVSNVIRGVPQQWSWVPGTYLLAFGPSYLYALVYWLYERDEGAGPVRCVAWCHLFVLYGLLAGVFGWRALARECLGRSGWAKTSREAEHASVPEAMTQEAQT